MILAKIFGPKVDFYKLLETQCDFIMMSVEALYSYVETLDSSYSDKVKSLEKEGDKARWELVQALNKTFITPFDREDIFMFSKSLDDILDYYKTTVGELEIYQIQPTPQLINFVNMLKNGSQYISESVYCLKTDPNSSIQCAMKAKKCENKVEEIYRNSVAKLLYNDDIKYIIKMRELYRHLSNCADRIDQSADFVCHILIKEIS